MCVILHKPKNVKLDLVDFLDCAGTNPDGFGYMYQDKNTVRIEKGFFDVYDLLASIDDSTKPDQELVVHFRISTAGKINQSNCHPFPISDDIKKLKSISTCCNFGMCHNGILSGIGYVDDLKVHNDTILLIRDYLAKQHKKSFIHTLKVISDMTTNKFCVMTPYKVHRIGYFPKIRDIYYSNNFWNYVPVKSYLISSPVQNIKKDEYSYVPDDDNDGIYDRHDCQWCTNDLDDCENCDVYEKALEYNDD